MKTIQALLKSWLTNTLRIEDMVKTDLTEFGHTDHVSGNKRLPPWKVIIADDDKDIQKLTRRVLLKFSYEGKGLELISAHSEEETKQLVRDHPDAAAILLDVVMDSSIAGLNVVRYIREELKNNLIQIVLRTGQPAMAPESEVIAKYQINDYKYKPYMTSQVLINTITTMLRSYHMAYSIHELNQKLGKELIERERAEKALRQSEELYRSLAETMRDNIISIDLKGNIIYVNRAGIELCGYSNKEMLEMNISDILHTKSIDSDNQYYFYEGELINKSGKRTPVEVSSSVMMDHDLPKGMLITARDITEKNLAREQARLRQDQLLQAAKMASLGTLVSGVAHEINNPITSVMLNAPILQKVWASVLPVLEKYAKADDSFHVGSLSYSQICERVPALLADIVDGAKRVKNIVEDLKDFARQNLPEMIDDIDINSIVKKSIGLVNNLIKKSTDHFSVTYGPDIPTFRGNTQRIEQVVINLLVNACHALSDNKKSIIVTTEYNKKNDMFIIKVIDQGSGMPPEVLQRIKDPFFTTRRDSGGTGLGLSISDGIIDDHMGSLDFFSEPGKGTTARISLPGNPLET